MRDQITITGISGKGFHGVMGFERQNGQRFSADVTLYSDFAKASASDDLADTIDYSKVAELTHAMLVGEPVNLIEALADRIARAVLDLGGIDEVEVTIHKPHAPIEVAFDDVHVIVRRSANEN
ncbi:MAG: dihydroneopterin aldolase [Candidatus Nanopelagicales bacterium]